ncbi:hypothetical protein H9P43_007102 [Blastocladiella emersonii ATCC 22665]|nr:hypothetical protein H9P43_007102 [Blastocladiella emersonii ATCC 22665]
MDASVAADQRAAARKSSREFLAGLSAELRELSLKIYNHPELAFEEVYAAATIREYLGTKPGVTVTDSKATEIPTAFVATFEHLVEGKDAKEVLTIGFCSEYDALPMGHACGHNLICISGVGAFLTAAHLITEFGLPARLRLFGTPGEEGLGGKINMISAGDMAATDFLMMLHPGNIDLAFPTYLALQTFDVEYFGREAHASGAPWDGINALDAIINAYNGISHVRQQITPTDRVHGIIRNGGAAPNIIPAHTSGTFMTRSTEIAHLRSFLLPKVLACIESGARSTGCTYSTSMHPPYFDVNTNAPMAQVYETELREQLAIALPSPDVQKSISRGSTDCGNISYLVCPTIHSVFDTGCKAEIHSVEFLAHAKTEEAHNHTLDRIACLVMVAFQLLTDGDLRDRARAEFARSTKTAEAAGVFDSTA